MHPPQALAPPRPRILIRRFPPVVGGMERQCAGLCARWAAAGVPVEVWTRHIVPGTPAVETVDGFTLRRLRPGGTGRWGEYGSLPIIARRLVLGRRSYDVAAVFGGGWLALAAGLAAGRAARPWLFRPATAGDLTRFLDPAAIPAGGPVRHWLHAHVPPPAWRAGVLRRAAAVVAVSDEIAAELERWGFDESRIASIPNGVDTDRFRPIEPAERLRLRAELGLPPDAAIVLFLGRLVARKGVLDLVHAWRKLREDPLTEVRDRDNPLPSTCLVIAGSGAGQADSVEEALRPAVESVAGSIAIPNMDASGESPAPTIRLVGPVPDPARWLAASDVFVLPSHQEGLSNALLEAMASGRLVVASDLPSTRAVVQSATGARLFLAGDIDSLAAALRAAIEAARRGADGMALRERVIADFSLDTAAERYLQLFKRLASGSGR